MKRTLTIAPGCQWRPEGRRRSHSPLRGRCPALVIPALLLALGACSGGSSPSVATTAPSLSRYRPAISARGNHTCALTSAGGVRCWGRATTPAGQATSADAADGGVPIDVAGLGSGVTAVAVGGSHACALTAAGGVKCWGRNDSGQLGNGSVADSNVPVDVAGLASGVTAIAAGNAHVCALTTAGGVKCWGANSFGQLGNGTYSQSNTPVDVSGLQSGVAVIAAGGLHTCAATPSGAVKCWGYNGRGQLGDGTTNNSDRPVGVVGLERGAMIIGAGDLHSCAATSTGGVKCWGDNSLGQLGNGTKENSATPVDVSGLASGATALALGDLHSCAITTGGALKCWGLGFYGELGNGTTADSSRPVNVTGMGSGTASAAGGAGFTCAVGADGAVRCWGRNDLGQLGNGTAANSATPVLTK